MQILQNLVKLDAVILRLKVGAQRDFPRHKLLRQLGNIFDEPASQRVLVHIFVRAEHNDEFRRVDRAVSKANGHEKLLSVLVNQCQ